MPTTLVNTGIQFPDATIQTTAATTTTGIIRSWVNFNGTGTIATRASANVSSLTDNGTGDYTVNFTTAMVDANYSLQCTGRFGGSAVQNQPFFKGDTAWQTASSVRFNFNFHITNGGNTTLDAELVNVVVVR
jgi:hypothetical protein